MKLFNLVHKALSRRWTGPLLSLWSPVWTLPVFSPVQPCWPVSVPTTLSPALWFLHRLFSMPGIQFPPPIHLVTPNYPSDPSSSTTSSGKPSLISLMRSNPSTQAPSHSFIWSVDQCLSVPVDQKLHEGTICVCFFTFALPACSVGIQYLWGA